VAERAIQTITTATVTRNLGLQLKWKTRRAAPIISTASLRSAQ